MLIHNNFLSLVWVYAEWPPKFYIWVWTEHFLTSGLYFKAQDVAIELRFRFLSDEILHMVYHDDITKKYEYRHIIIVGIYQCTACAIIISVNDNKVRMEYLGHILSCQIY